jgi:hypothetical protein
MPHVRVQVALLNPSPDILTFVKARQAQHFQGICPVNPLPVLPRFNPSDDDLLTVDR